MYRCFCAAAAKVRRRNSRRLTVPCLESSPDSDSWVSQSSSGNNFGADSTLKVKSQSGGANSLALVRFPLPALPAGCTRVASATLRLHAGSATSGRTLEAFQIAFSWTEGGVTWSNQPAVTGVAATAPSGPGLLEWSVTDRVWSMYSGGNHGFLIRDAAESGTGTSRASKREGRPTIPRLRSSPSSEREEVAVQ